MNKLYLLSFGAQKDIVDKNCFKCGKIIVGGIEAFGGLWFSCREPKCPIEADDSPLDMGESELTNGKIEHIFIRKLK